MHKTRFIVLALIAAVTATIGAETASRIPANAGAGATVVEPSLDIAMNQSLSSDPFASFPGKILDRMECASIHGGDVNMILNAQRTKLQVRVISNEYEARLGRIPPIEVFEIDVHNRVVDTKQAPFIPTAKSKSQTSGQDGLTCRPEQFPEGYWNVTAMRTLEGKYGPYMISTNAVGKVDVFAPSAIEGEIVYLGNFADTGYAIHSNSNPFKSSKSNGCLIIRKEDSERLAITLANDRMNDKNSRQTLRINRDR